MSCIGIVFPLSCICCIILLLAIHNYLVFTNQSCENLMRDGAFSNNPGTRWKPYGCLLKVYDRTNTNECLQIMYRRKNSDRTDRRAYVVFVGDSRMRQLRDQLYALLTNVHLDWLSNRSVALEYPRYNKHSDRSTNLSNVVMDFIWAPNITGAVDRLQKFANRTAAENRYPDMMVFGNGVWTNTYCLREGINQTECLPIYKRAFTDLIPVLRAFTERTRVVWAPQTPASPLMIHTASVRGKLISHEKINLLLQRALNESRGHGLTMWGSFVSVFSLTDSLDGIHMGPIAAYYSVQILLNYICNPLSADLDREFCCSFQSSSVYPFNLPSWIICGAGALILIFVVGRIRCQKNSMK